MTAKGLPFTSHAEACSSQPSIVLVNVAELPGYQPPAQSAGRTESSFSAAQAWPIIDKPVVSKIINIERFVFMT
jgi:hypothetical protein